MPKICLLLLLLKQKPKPKLQKNCFTDEKIEAPIKSTSETKSLLKKLKLFKKQQKLSKKFNLVQILLRLKQKLHQIVYQTHMTKFMNMKLFKYLLGLANVVKFFHQMTSNHLNLKLKRLKYTPHLLPKLSHLIVRSAIDISKA